MSNKRKEPSFSAESMENRPWIDSVNSSRIYYLRQRDKKQRIASCGIFQNYAKYFEEIDSYWCNIFGKCALSKLPKDFSFWSPYLSYTKKKDAKIKIVENPTEQEVLEVKEFFRKYGHLSSPLDEMEEENEEEASDIMSILDESFSNLSIGSGSGGGGSGVKKRHRDYSIVGILLSVSRQFPPDSWCSKIIEKYLK